MENHIDVKNSSFSELEEIKKQTACVDFAKGIAEGAGPPVYYDKSKGIIQVDDGEGNTLSGSAIGTGKTRSLIIQAILSILLKGESCVVHDAKSEIYKFTYKLAKKLGYKTIILNFRKAYRGDSYNVLFYAAKLIIQGDSKGYEILYNYVENICESVKNNDDPYWSESATSYIKALLLVLIREFGPEYCTLENVLKLHYYFNTRSKAKTMAGKIKGLIYYENHPEAEEKDQILQVLDGALETKRGIFMTMVQALSKYCQNKDIINLISTNTFAVEELVEKKFILYLETMDENSCYDSIVSNYVHFFYEYMIGRAEEDFNGKLPIRVNFVFDEFSNMGKIKDMEKKISASRSRRIRFVLVVQSFYQLEKVYGKETANIIIENCENWIYFYSSHMGFVKMLSERCGMRDSDNPLISPYELLHLNKEKREALILLKRCNPFITQLPDISELVKLEEASVHDIPERVKKTRLIDISKLDCSIEKDENLIFKTYEAIEF